MAHTLWEVLGGSEIEVKLLAKLREGRTVEQLNAALKEMGLDPMSHGSKPTFT
ncbi:MAG TPA: hypothetical protein PLY00_18075 [Verrucomicrobiota bacterium]|nr:hypothetical protein [Verrucomicrobiota bacterium]HOR73167.1 hypothetical protein [Verrucomicrobiota bacterium]HQK02426.1 hypothetical protein [Verrucomicrobiota bacterium]